MQLFLAMRGNTPVGVFKKYEDAVESLKVSYTFNADHPETGTFRQMACPSLSVVPVDLFDNRVFLTQGKKADPVDYTPTEHINTYR